LPQRAYLATQLEGRIFVFSFRDHSEINQPVKNMFDLSKQSLIA
jgi:hypothetical protein